MADIYDIYRLLLHADLLGLGPLFGQMSVQDRASKTSAKDRRRDENRVYLAENASIWTSRGNFPHCLRSLADEFAAPVRISIGSVTIKRRPRTVVYRQDGAWSVVRPDFLFFSQAADGSVVVDIIDPHGTFLADALPKLKGLADYAEAHADVFRRIEAVDEIDGVLKVLDLRDPAVRGAVRAAESAIGIYKDPTAKPYAR